MSEYIGDFAEDVTLNFKFTTVNLSQVPTTLAGSPVLKVYKGDATGTESTAGITTTIDFDSVTGLTNVKIDLSADAFYATGEDYQVVITTGTVDSISVVGSVVREFSIENRFEEADTTMTTQMTEGYAADGVAPTPTQALFRIMQNICEFSISGVTLTTKKIDKSTQAEAYELNDPNKPTQRTRSS